MILATSGRGFDANNQIVVSWIFADCDESRPAGREEADSMCQLWGSLSVHDALQQGSFLDIPIQFPQFW